MTDIEAQKESLLGSDVYKRSQLAYTKDFNRDNFVCYLNREAYKVFMSSLYIRHSSELKGHFEIMKRHIL
ncbi:MAG: hypothetical protein HOP11_04360 [Saprospiraceae bacterium]|nr:hypothetical protein [Saprospiraceae bacterium]